MFIIGRFVDTDDGHLPYRRCTRRQNTGRVSSGSHIKRARVALKSETRFPALIVNYNNRPNVFIVARKC